MRSFKIIAVFCALTPLTGCAMRRYRPVPLSPVQAAASLKARSLADPGLRVFIAKFQSAPATWPLAEWSLADLTLAAFYYNPALAITGGRLSEAEAAIVTAGARPNPSGKADVGGETAAESPWIAGFGFSLPIETVGKRRYRISQAERLADVARWDLTSTAWKVQAQVRSALLEYVTAERNVSLLAEEERLGAEQVALLEQRFAVGMIPRPEVDTARIQHTQTLLAFRAAEGRVSQAEASLAAAVGVPVAAPRGVTIVWPSFDQPPRAASLNPAIIQEDAVLNRLDIRRALADYHPAAAALPLEIAKQYPDFDLGPDYAFEEGAHLFSVALGLTLPVFNRNQGPIAEAQARRDQMAGQFICVQSCGIADSEQGLFKYRAAIRPVAEA